MYLHETRILIQNDGLNKKLIIRNPLCFYASSVLLQLEGGSFSSNIDGPSDTNSVFWIGLAI